MTKDEITNYITKEFAKIITWKYIGWSQYIGIKETC
jgi:hypothetical protein